MTATISLRVCKDLEKIKGNIMIRNHSIAQVMIKSASEDSSKSLTRTLPKAQGSL
jgi:hypothetical protein